MQQSHGTFAIAKLLVFLVGNAVLFALCITVHVHVLYIGYLVL